MLQSTISKNCRTILHLIDSESRDISFGVRDLSVENSFVYSINLTDQINFYATKSEIKNVDMLQIENFGGGIRDSEIDYIGTLIANDGLSIINSRILNIKSRTGMTLKGNYSLIENSTFGHIRKDGLLIQSKTTLMKNVFIAELNFKSIFVDKYHTLEMENVTIILAEENCIFAEFSDNLIIKNVTISGEPLEFRSKWVMSEWKKLSPSKDGILVQRSDTEHCNLVQHELTCDYDGVSSVS